MKIPWVALILASLQGSVICGKSRSPPEMENLNEFNLGLPAPQVTNIIDAERDMDEMPTFETSSCSDVQMDKEWDLCIKVTYPIDDKNDYMLLEIFDSGTKTYIGKMKEEEIPVVFSWPDEDDGEVNATAQFHSKHFESCVDFHIDLGGVDATGNSDCINVVIDDGPTLNEHLSNDILERYAKNIEQRSELDSNGYELNLDVYFDDDLLEYYGDVSVATSKMRKVMAYVQNMFLQKDTLKTTIKLNFNIEHKSGEEWALAMARYSNTFQTQTPDRGIWETMGSIAESATDKHLYVFVTSMKGSVYGGWAPVGSLCGSRSRRVSISRYYQSSSITTAQTIGHEMGHNIGMSHDFIGTDTSNVKKDKDGNDCFGYMDYNLSGSHYWSACSVEDFSEQNKCCLTGTSCCRDNRDDCGDWLSFCGNPDFQWFTDACEVSCGTCDEATCYDGIQNGDEEGIDCGGTISNCIACPTCTDGIQNGDEEGVDCGGTGGCSACPTCTDGIQNGDEEGVDCGGTGGCSACPTCTDGIQNGDEEGVDCGGTGGCSACPTCIDGIQNGDEEGVDCGGTGGCPACPTCTDGIQNGFETDVDCGGSDCPECQTGVDVCFDIVVTTTQWGSENSWVLGTCASTMEHENHNTHEAVECCLPPGEYTLECKDSYGDGWHGGYITVNGAKYCENFDSSSLETHEILISSDTEPEGCQHTTVTIQTTTKSYGYENSWTIGSCTNERQFENDETVSQTCCLAAGFDDLECKDTYGDGWHGGYLEINGETFCEDFTSGHSKTEVVTI